MIEALRRGRALLHRAAPLVALVAVLLAPAATLAQEFEKFEGKGTENIPAVPFVGLAYGFIWVAVLAYVVYIARGLARARGEIAELKRRVSSEEGRQG